MPAEHTVPSAHWLAQPGQAPPTAFSRRREGHRALCTLAQSGPQRRPLPLSCPVARVLFSLGSMGFTRVLWHADRGFCKRWRQTRHRPHAAGSSLGDGRAAACLVRDSRRSPLTSARQKKRRLSPNTLNLDCVSPLPSCPAALAMRIPPSQHKTLRKQDGALWLLGWPGRGTWSDSTRQGKV
jgi:hypothetical protein